MDFKVSTRYLDRTKTYPNNTIILEENKWDDYSFKTTFEVFYAKAKEYPRKIGSIQIANVNKSENVLKPGGYSTIDDIPEEFNKLGNDYISSGNIDLYESLSKIFGNQYRSILRKLNDININDDLYDKYKDLEVVKTSFHRSICDYELDEIKSVAKGNIRFNYDFTISYLDEWDFEITNLKFSTSSKEILPTNIHAIIGDNGTGKTTILKDILEISVQNSNKIESQFKRENKIYVQLETKSNLELQSLDVYFEKIVFISFSAFDNFEENTHYFKESPPDNVQIIGSLKKQTDKEKNIDTSEEQNNGKKINDYIFEEYLEKLFENKANVELFFATISDLNMLREEIKNK